SSARFLSRCSWTGCWGISPARRPRKAEPRKRRRGWPRGPGGGVAWFPSGLGKNSGDDGLVDDAPAPVLAGPVLALHGARRHVVRAVVLLEGDHHQAGRSGVGEEAHVLHADLDPGLARGDLLLLRAPRRVVARVGAEIARVVGEVARGVAAF